MNRELIVAKMDTLTEAELESVVKSAADGFLRGAAAGLLDRRKHLFATWSELVVDDETAAALDELERVTGKNVRVA